MPEKQGGGALLGGAADRDPLRDREPASHAARARSSLTTALRIAEADLKASLEQNRAQGLLLDVAVNKMKQGLCFFDGEERLILANRRYAEIYGLSLDQTRSGTTLREIVEHRYAAGTGPDMPLSEYLIRRRVVAASPTSTDTVLHLRDGRIIAIHHEPMPDGGWVATHDDITEVTEAKQRLSASERRYRALVEASSSILWRADANGAVLESDGWEAFSGQTAEEYRGDGWLSVVHPDDQARVCATCEESLRTGKPLLAEYRLKHVSGEYRWVLSRGVPVRAEDGTVEEWVGTVTDQHEKRQAEEAVYAADERFRSLMSTSPDAIVCLDAQGLITFWNAAAEKTFGYRADEVLCRPAEIIIPERFQAAHRIGLMRAVRQGGANLQGGRTVQFTARRRSGEEFPVEVSLSTWTERGCQSFGAVIRDITEREAAERRAQQAHARLLEAIEAMPAGLVFYDPEDRLVLCNRRYQEIYAESAGTLVPGTRFEDILRDGLARGIYAEARGRETEWLQERLARHSEARNVHEQPLARGRWVRIEDSRTADGGTIGVRLDITELKRREEELRARNVQFDAALSNMSHGLAMFDADEKLIICNERYNEIHCTSPDVVKPGITYQEFLEHRIALGLSDRERTEAFLMEHRAHIKAGQPFTHTREFKDGRTVTMSYQPMSGGGWVVTLEDVTERCQAELRINYLAYHDTLTDLPNRFLFQDRLDQGLLRAKRQGKKVGLILIDLDGFKDVNDTLGHDAGDALLRLTAGRLRSAVREVDTVARLGGDEFAMVLPDVASLDEVIEVTKRLQMLLREPFEFQDHSHAGRASMGIVLYPDHDTTPAELMKDADIALYAAKAQGRNRYVAFSPDLKRASEHRIAVLAQVREALSQNQIAPYYQPKICFATGRIAGFEALLRWLHPNYGIVAPGAIAPAFEDPELAIALGEHMLEHILADARSWLGSKLAFGHVALNLSAAEFAQRDLAERLLSRLAGANLPARCLQVEVTETVFLGRNSAEVGAILRRLHAAGVKIALDDFGTGFASLTHLKQFPIDGLKVDRSFVGALEHDADDAAIVSAVIGLGRNLQMEVTAEGVETEAQVQFLREQGCSYGQGYYYAKPMAAARVVEFLSTWTSANKPLRDGIISLEHVPGFGP